MKHAMGLYEEPFYSIKSGRKKVEVRLYDKKRRKLALGDVITFTKIPDGNETITVEIIELRTYPTFREMYESTPAKDLDAVGGSIDQMVERTYQIYNTNEEKRCGTIAISIKRILPSI